MRKFVAGHVTKIDFFFFNIMNYRFISFLHLNFMENVKNMMW